MGRQSRLADRGLRNCPQDPDEKTRHIQRANALRQLTIANGNDHASLTATCVSCIQPRFNNTIEIFTRYLLRCVFPNGTARFYQIQSIHLLNLFPALRVSIIHIPGVTVRHRRATSAPPEQLAFRALLELLGISLLFHCSRKEHVAQRRICDVPDFALHATARIYVACG